MTGATDVSGNHIGVDGVRAHMERFRDIVEPGAPHEDAELVGDGDTVVYLSEGVMRSRSGREYNNRCGFVFKFDGLKIRSVSE